MAKSSKKKQIFGVSDSLSLFIKPWEDPVYFRQLVSLIDEEEIQIVYVGAARSGDFQRVVEFYQLADRVGFHPRILNFFDMITDDPDEYFKGAHIIYIDGGSSKNLLALLKTWNAVSALQNAYDNGIVIAGASAGICVMFDWFVTDSVTTKILPLRGLGFLKGTICVHHNVRADRRAAFNALLSSPDASFPAYTLDDSVAIHFIDGELAATHKLLDGAECRVLARNSGKLSPPDDSAHTTALGNANK